jgi:hydrogenase nickel incorporation protein HypA/HybF
VQKACEVLLAGFLCLTGDTMHEMAITEGIIDLCLLHAAGRRVRSVDVEIGNLSSVGTEAIEFCFDACSRDTLLEGATLSIVRIAGQGECLECGAILPMIELFAACQECGSNRVTIIAGEELRVREIEVDD